MEIKSIWSKYSSAELEELEMLSKDYKEFLDGGKTERECIDLAKTMAIEAGYKDLNTYIDTDQSLKVGDKIFATHMNKTIVLFEIGSDDIRKGMNILGAHVDSPRLDVKTNPLYESNELAYLDTHYYGGIKKYQWLATPLSLHGVVAKKDGSVIKINIGENEEDPVFVVTDLLPHLDKGLSEKKANEFVNGEKLDLLIGNLPFKDAEKDGVKETVLKILEKHYHFAEEDFLSAELEIVPAGKARDLGLDRSMILAYGQDDRVCAYTSLLGMLETSDVERTTCTLLVDKEEIGSEGATGMESMFFENTVAEVVNLLGFSDNLAVRRTMQNSTMLSSDVNAAFDPLFADVYEPKNSSFLAHGLVFNKFTGARGKSGANDANAEYIAKLRKVLDDNEVSFQLAELGAVDIGGGGTIAFLMAKYGMSVIDAGVAVLSMHALYEGTSKADIYEAYKGYKAFLKDMR
ncbi:MAG: aminopeptidase [Lachnospiraceae bacterium]|jgi:aspartyl aminopeptidase|nr:aminopeptidase [Lachnospiraceae bacterium]